MSINWNNLRSWNGSHESAFEELCCQLASLESVPAGAQFFRKGTPDAGVECFWRLPSNDEWAWQAKFFRSSPKPSQWQQIDASIKTALAKHPRLTKYTVCLPLDRSDARIKNQKTFLAKWNDYIIKWQRRASKKKMSVSFEYWGQSELGFRLSNETQQGRHWFWFNDDRFSNSWFVSRVDEAVANAGDRYTPELNIDLPLRYNFDALGRTSEFFTKLQGFYSEFRIKLKALRPLTQPSSLQERYNHILEIASELLATIEPWAEPAKVYSEWSVKRTIPWNDIGRLAKDVRDTTRACVSEMYEFNERPKGEDEKGPQGIGGDYLNWEIYKLRQFEDIAVAINVYARSSESTLSNLPALLLVGSAGQGKTHLLCDIAKHETLKSRPRIMFHGEQFRDDEPWSQMITLLGLNCSREQFIGGLEAAGQANNCRVLIFIDAMNEGEGNRLWSKFLPGILTTLMQSQWLGICVSVRTSYEDYIIPKSLDETRLVRVNHGGFGELATNAVEKFFSHFNIEPSAPILLPEFENPLFLKLFCQSLHNQELRRIPPGLEGITAIFGFFVDSINKKLSRPEYLDFDSRSRVVSKAVEVLSDEMAKQGIDRLPLSDTRETVNKILPRSGNQKSLFRHLETESIVTVVPDYWDRGDGMLKEYVRFSYQRFSDHLITGRLLARHFDKTSPKESLSPRGKLGRLVKDERTCWMNKGILEALAIQIPEITRNELPDLAVHLASLQPMREAFVESIIWRDPASFTDATDRYINKEILTSYDTFEDFWNAMIAVGTSAKHPLNARRLHDIRSRNELANRDAWWSIFLHQEWGKERALDRIVNWALADNDKSAVNDDVIRLAGILLAWFFITSNRFLRDKATKAMVRLFESRLRVLRQVIEMFVRVDDPYVAERLYAVAYGCAMRTSDDDALKDLAQDVYLWVFEAGRPPPHILLRDYARGVIEMALYRGAHLNIDIPKIRPPYLSDWPSFSVPTAEQLRPIGETTEGMPDEEWGRVSIYHSLMGDVLGDFSHYVVGSFDQWSSERIDEPHKPTHRETHDEFVKSLTHSQRIAWKFYLDACQNPNIAIFFSTTAKKELLPEKIAQTKLKRMRMVAEKNLLRSLGPNSTKYKTFKKSVRNYVLNSNKYYRENRLDGLLARRWMLQRIMNMGWTVERFGKFDRNINAYRNSGSGSNKPERIGKKYQWLAFHELLARLSDNFKMRSDHWSGREAEYHGPWDLGRRDIDPSNLLLKTQRGNWGPQTNTWWFPARYSFWDEERKEIDWLKNTKHLPQPMDIIEITDPKNGSHWLTLDGSYHWEQPTPLGEDHYDQKRRDLWYMLTGYLIKRSDSQKLGHWAINQNWMGRWMPESHGSSDVFLGEFFWSPAAKDRDDPYYGRNGWTRDNDRRLPCEVLPVNDGYSWSASSYDCSVTESLGINLPCRFLVESMNLNWRGEEGCWYDSANQLVAFDPSVRSTGPSVLLFRKEPLLEFLDRTGLTLLWTLLGEKRTIGGPMGPEPYHGHLEINGAYILSKNHVSGRIRAQFVTPNHAISNVTTSKVGRRNRDDVS